MKLIIAATMLAGLAAPAYASCADHPNGRAYYEQHCDVLEGNPLPPTIDRQWSPNGAVKEAPWQICNRLNGGTFGSRSGDTGLRFDATGHPYCVVRQRLRVDIVPLS